MVQPYQTIVAHLYENKLLPRVFWHPLSGGQEWKREDRFIQEKRVNPAKTGDLEKPLNLPPGQRIGAGSG